MKASVPDPFNGAGRSSTNGRFLGLKKSTLSLATAIFVGTPLLVACDNASSMPVNTEVTSTPTAPSKQTPAPTTTQAQAETTTSKAPKPTSTKVTTTSEKPAPSTSVSPEPVEPQADLKAIQKALDTYRSEAEGGVAKQELVNALTARGFNAEDVNTVINSNNIVWSEEASKEADFLLNGLKSPTRDALTEIFWADSNASLFTADEIQFAVEDTDWQPYANEQVARLYSDHQPATKAQLLTLSTEYLWDFTNEEVEKAADQYDWASKERAIVDSYRATIDGGLSRYELVDWLWQHGYTFEEAEVAADQQGIDWNEEALIEAQGIKLWHPGWFSGLENIRMEMEYSPRHFMPDVIEYAMKNLDYDLIAEGTAWAESTIAQESWRSKDEMTDELRHGGLSEDEAATAINGIDVNWEKRMLLEAERQLQNSKGMSESELREELGSVFEGFIGESEIAYALKNVDADWNKQAVIRGEILVKNSWTTLSYYDLYDELSRAPISFTHDEAEYAIQNVKVDWKEHAISKLDSYLSHSNFSKERAVSQLVFTGYTQAQADAAVETKSPQVWKDNAVREARIYLRSNSPARYELVNYLTSRFSTSFTREEAEYAADQVGLTEYS